LTVEQFVAILAAMAVLLGAVARCIAEVRYYHSAVNSKMDRLLAVTSRSSRARGRLDADTAAARANRPKGD
jgi:Na+/H+-dicarboxylate symporter